MKLFAILGLLFSVNAFRNDGHVNLPPSPVGARIETENPRHTSDGVELYQGDMILTEEQKEWLESPSGMRKARNDQKYLWPGAVIQFRISPSSMKDRPLIFQAMRNWTLHSCVTFEGVPDDYPAPHLIFIKGSGCWSHVGRLYYQNGQNISIGEGCEAVGVITHEIGHALGFHHEQARPDRDNYVVVLNQNLNQTMARNFRLEPDADTFGIPYDLGSLMHYGTNGFSINRRNTLVTKDPLKHFMIGQREKLSFADFKLATLLYNCACRCGENKCLNDGYLGHQACQCECPPGFSGKRCENGAPVDNALTCGGSVNSATTIGFPNSNASEIKSRCVWVVTAPAGKRVHASFREFRIAPRWARNNECMADYLELRTNDLYDGVKYCGLELRGFAITSQSNTMVFVFETISGDHAKFESSLIFV